MMTNNRRSSQEKGDKPLTKFQKFLIDGRLKYIKETGEFYGSDNQYAAWLGVSPSTLNTWINGLRLPETDGALLISQRLGAKETFAALGKPVVMFIPFSQLIYINEVWKHLPGDTIAKIMELVDKNHNGSVTINTEEPDEP